ncbi:hypothetical protein [Candidatus Uabimicrobium amorphum]|uniref:Haloacid dehalogenase n=1 Tax=Uabimicrobium amorphum TaxID=2596890 RepID=A0A5S9IUC4_UABAM|nr:hypothetical protein [Candidatus Uabimicrobium amorphum]BBM87532.1 haloacid dehalogenase [Candidatus Uabimicrobium amorphum]
MNNTIALDIGRVCVHLNYELCAQKLGFSSTQELLNCHEIWRQNNLLETGKISTADFITQLQNIFPSKTALELREAWQAIIGPQIQGIQKVVASFIDKKLRVVLLSNTSQLHFAHIKKQLSFYQNIHGAVLSYEVGYMKPHSAIYEYFEEKYSRPLLFIDDKEENIHAAQERGWECYQMGNMHELQRICEAV